MEYYTRKQIVELLAIDEGFLVALEDERIIQQDAGGTRGEFSEKMLERIRVAMNLTRDLDVNLAGVAVIVRMREEMAELQSRVRELADELRRR